MTVRDATELLRTRKLPFLAVSGQFRRAFIDLSRKIERVYQSIAVKAGTEVIIDSSKHPLFAYCLSLAPSIDLYLVHLVRDPRGMVSSWAKPKGYLGSKLPLETALIWGILNGTSEILFNRHPRRFLVRYEDLTDEPGWWLREICKRCNFDVNERGGDSFVVNKKHHILAGNPEKLVIGSAVKVRPRKWHLPRWIDIQTRSLTFVLGKRYGYW